MPVSRHLSKLAGLLAVLAFAPAPAALAAMCDTPASDCEILSNRTYTDPNTYDYTGWNSLDLMSVGGVYPTITQTGGTVIAKRLALWNGVAYNMSGGAANISGDTIVAIWSSGVITSSFNQTGGTLNTGGNLRLALYNGNTGIYTLSGGNVNVGGYVRLVDGSPTNAKAYLYLNGGTLTTNQIIRDGFSGQQTTVGVQFNGGTLRASGNSDNPNWFDFNNGWLQLYNITYLGLDAGGAIFDTNGRNMGIQQPLPATWSQGSSTPSSPYTSGGVTKRGAGTLTLSAGNAYGGNTTVEAGAVALANVNAAVNSTVVLTGGPVSFSGITNATLGGLAGSQNFALQNTGSAAVALTVGNNGTNTTYSGAMSGSGSLNKIGGGTLELRGLNSFTGGTTVNAGTLRLSTPLGDTGAIRGGIVVNGATLETASVDALGYGNGVKADSIAINGGTLVNSAAGNNGWGIAYTLNGATMQSNGGTANATAASKFSFGGPSGGNNTSVNVIGTTASSISGHVDLRGDNGNTNVNFTVNAGATLNIPAAVSETGATPPAGVGLTKLGGGLLTLQAANTYTGSTVVSAGTLSVTGATGSGALSVANGATLTGNGSIGGAATIAGGGHVAPGNPLGALTFAGGVALNSGAVLDLALGTTSDLVRVSGGTFASAGGVTINLADSGGFGAGSYTLADFTGATASGINAASFTLGTTPSNAYVYALSIQGSKLMLTASVPVPPLVTSVSGPADGLYGAGQWLAFVVHFDHAVFVAGAPRLVLNVPGMGAQYANYATGSGTADLVFQYQVASGTPNATTGVTLAGSVDLNGGTLRDGQNTNANPTLNSPPSLAGLTLDGTAPAVTSIALVGTPPSTSLGVSYTVKFSESVTGVVPASFAVETVDGTATGQVGTVSGNANSYTVAVNGIGGVGHLRLALKDSGSGIADPAGNAISGGFHTGDPFQADVQRICMVRAAATGANDGTSWTDAYTDLQSAVRNAGCVEVWAAKGVYKPGVAASDSFRPRAGVKLYGGFAGAEASVGERTPGVIAANPTVLSGDIDGNDVTDANGIVLDAAQIAGSNSTNVILMNNGGAAGYATSTVIDGFIITAGDAGSGSNGGGLRCDASLLQAHCDFTLGNLVFSGNRAGGGGALSLSSSSGTANAVISKVLFRGNRAIGGGASGGAVFLSAAAAAGTVKPAFVNVIFSGNSSQNWGGAIDLNVNLGTVMPTFDNATFTANISNARRGGAIASQAFGTGGVARATFYNSILWGNAANAGDPEIALDANGAVSLNDSVLQGGCPGGNADCANLIVGDPLLGALGDHGGAIASVLPGDGGSAIDAATCAVMDDIRGVARPQGAGCDAGAVEVRMSALTAIVNGSGSVSAGATPVPATGGIVNCTDHCTATYDAEAQPTVTLTATPAAQWSFQAWGGDCSGSDRIATVAITAAKSCTATFVQSLTQTTLTLSAGANPAAYGATLGFTATVLAVAPATQTPTGNVDFYDGDALLGSATLAGDGTATFTIGAIAALDVGAHVIVATYSGDANYLASAQPPSNTLPIQIDKATQTLVFPPQTSAIREFVANATYAIAPPAFASSSLAPVYSSRTPDVCGVNGASVTMLTAGTCTLAANQPGDGHYEAAEQVTQSVLQATRCYVSASATGASDGSSWSNAYATLQAALPASAHCGEVWIARGRYLPPDANGFVVARPIKLYGGFAGVETDLAQRTLDVIAANPTVLSGDLDGNDVADANGVIVDAQDIAGANSNVLLSLSAANHQAANTAFDGLIVTAAGRDFALRCSADAPGQACSFTIANTVFSGNRGSYGGALSLSAHGGGSANPVLTNVLFRGNAAIEGGAIYLDTRDAGSSASPVLTQTIFADNTASANGGAIANYSDLAGAANAVLMHAVFVGNRAGSGGAIFNVGAGSHPVLRNSILWGDAAGSNAGNEVWSVSGAMLDFDHDIVQNSGGSANWNPDFGTDLGGNLDADPLLGALGWHGGAIPTHVPGVGSPAIDTAWCAGDAGAPAGLPATDARGIARPQGAGCDRGAIEVVHVTLGVQVSGAGSVSATPAPTSGGIAACTASSGACSGQYHEETAVALTAAPDADAHFVAWGGDCDANGQVTLERGDAVCTAQFAPNGDVVFDTLAFTYDGAARTITAQLDGEPSATCTVTPSSVGPNAGSYPVSATCSLPGYSVSGSATAKIARFPVAIAANAQTRIYGEADPALTYAVDPPLFGSDGFTGTLARAPGENVGSYAITQGTLSAGPNYSLSFTGAQFTITKATATVTLSGLSATYDGQPHAVVVQTMPANLGVTVTYHGSTTPPVHAGSYDVTASVVDDNYQGSGQSATLVIARAATTLALSSPCMLTFVEGQPYTLVARLDGGVNATGSVRFDDGVDVLCDGVGLDGNVATCRATPSAHAQPTATLALGAHYVGDVNHLPADSNPLIVTVLGLDDVIFRNGFEAGFGESLFHGGFDVNGDAGTCPVR